MFPSSLSLVATAAAFTACLAASSASGAVLFQNGFEFPVVNHTGPSGNSGGYDNYGTGQAIGPWTVVGAPGVTDAVSVVTSNFTQNGFSFVAQSGQQWADLAGQDANSNYGVRTTVAGLLGQSYSVSFWVGNVVDPANVFGESTTVNLLVNNVPVFTAINTDGTGQTTQVWRQYTYNGFGLTDAITFTFLSGDPQSDFSSAFDNVTISTADTSPVPLPAALPLFATVLAGGGLIAWRRKRRAAKVPGHS
jgi:hypothetical protein